MEALFYGTFQHVLRDSGTPENGAGLLADLRCGVQWTGVSKLTLCCFLLTKCGSEDNGRSCRARCLLRVA